MVNPGSVLGEFYTINYSAAVDQRALAAYDFCIISPYAQIDLKEARQRGGRYYAYLSVGEIAPDAPYRTNAIQRKIDFLERNATWRSDVVDISQPAWSDLLLELAGDAAKKGFDGFFLDTVDSVELMMAKHPNRTRAYQQGLVELVRRLRREHPTKKIIINRGFDYLPALTNAVDGVLVESLYRTFDSARQKYVEVEAATTTALLRKLAVIQKTGLPIYVVDYVAAGSGDLAARTAEKIARLGYHPLVTTIDLQGPALAPLVPKPRHLMNIYGNQELDLANRIKFPADSFVGRSVQTVVEWLGYEMNYHNIVTDPVPGDLSPDYYGILIDRFVELPPEKEGLLVTWLLNHHRRGLKLIFLGELPFEQEEHRKRLFDVLGFAGSGNIIGHLGGLGIRTNAPLIGFETKVRPVANGFRHLTAPPDAQHCLSLTATNERGRPYRFDPVFIASWGGCALDPYLTFQRPDFCELWLLDPFAFFAAALRTGPEPVPDPTTRDGLRIFYSHIDGDGFGNRTLVEAGKRSAEIVRDRILKRYPYPITCSVIEAEIRGRVKGQDPKDEAKLIDIARSIFALPNVQAGSHSYTHPFYWMKNDRTAMNYEGQNLELVPPFDKGKLDLHREIGGSVDYINEVLLPQDKKVSVFLWSGNCRPGPDALRLVYELGIQNLNGGDTLISDRYPTITSVAPRTMMWDTNFLQVYASNQNENEFNDNWTGPFYGGYIHTIETFERTEKPRRLKPMNIYYHMYSADYHDSLRVLLAVHDFVHTQAVHAVTAAHYARIARDSRRTRIFRHTEDHYLLTNDGDCTTYRLPAGAKVPDVGRSKGVIGFREEHGSIYIHTDGSPKVDLYLTNGPQLHPYIISSTAPLQVERLTLERVAFTTEDFRPVEVRLGGFPRGLTIGAMINEEPHDLATDDQGRITLRLPPRARVVLPDLRLTRS